MVPATSPRGSFPIFGIVKSEWGIHRNDCSGFVRAVALDMAVPLHGRASATVNNGDADPGWTKLGSDPAKASQMVAQGQFVVAGKKEVGHQRVVVVTPGEGPHQMAIGYWRRLGGVGFKNKNKGLDFAWTRRSDEGAVSWEGGSEFEGEAVKTSVLGVLAGVVLAGAALASGTGMAFVQIIPQGASAEAGGYHLDLGGPDDPEAPRAWQGPIRITSAGNAGCTVSENVAIVERPLSLAGGRLLYVTTYSGSEAQVYVVDAQTCAVKWTSPNFVGIPRITTGTLALPGHRPFKVGADGLPVTRG